MSPSYHFDFSSCLCLVPPAMGVIAIYGLFDPRCQEPLAGLRYIGKTQQPAARLRHHLCPTNGHVTSHKDRWLRQLHDAGLEPAMRVLAWVSADEWEQAERACIAQAHAAGCRLTNLTLGGRGHAGLSPSEQTVQRIKASRAGWRMTPEQRARVAQARRRWYANATPEQLARFEANSAKGRAVFAAKARGSALPAQTRAKIAASLTGRTLSPAARAKVSQAVRGRVVSQQTRARMSASGAACWAAIAPEERSRRAARAHQARRQRGTVRPPISEETRAKMSERAKERERRKRERGRVGQMPLPPRLTIPTACTLWHASISHSRIPLRSGSAGQTTTTNRRATMITLDPGRSDDLPFADPSSGSREQPAQQSDQRERTLTVDDDQDGTLDPHEDGGQAGTEPDQGPSVGPAADSEEATA